MADLQFSIRTPFSCTLLPSEPSTSEPSTITAKTLSTTSPSPPQIEIFESKSNPSLKLILATSFDENDEINVLLKEKTLSDESFKIIIPPPCIEKVKETIEINSIDNLKNINETVLSNSSVVNNNINNNNSETILVDDPSSSSFVSQIQSITAVAVATASSMTATTPTITIVYLPTDGYQTPDDTIIEEDESINDSPQLFIITDKLPIRNDSITVDDLSPTTDEYQECMNFQKNVDDLDDDVDEYDLVTDGCNLAPGCVAPTPTPAPSIAPLAEVEIDPPDDEGDFEIEIDTTAIIDEIDEENDGGECSSSSFKPDDEKKKRKKRNSDSKKSDEELEQTDGSSKGNEQFAVCPWDEE